MSDVIYKKYKSIIPFDLPVVASSFQAGSSKYCRASRAQKWLYLSRSNSESSDLSCVGFPVGRNILKKILYYILECSKLQ